MKASSSLAMIIGFVIAAIGIIGLVSPDTYRLGGFWADAPWSYLFAAAQLVVGVVLVRAAPASRSPVGLGVVGALAIAEAALMPFLGHGRAHAVAHWWSSQSSGGLRLWALVELAVGVLVVIAVAPTRHHRPSAPATTRPLSSH